MPELPEVETVCRVMRRVLVDSKVTGVEVVPDSITYGSTPVEAISGALLCRTVRHVGRKGKVWWIDTGELPVIYGHLGMTGWIRELGAHTIRLKEHGEAPLDDDSGRPRFLKLLITAESGRQIAFTDGRRLAHVWLGDKPQNEPKIKKLGPDAFDKLPRGAVFEALFAGRKAPIKALLMDQALLSGLGNWLADEVLYQAKIAPQRLPEALSSSEVARLRRTISSVLKLAVEAGADDSKYPANWLFHHRWGGSRGVGKIGRHRIVREEVAGRTTAWVPAVQRQ